MSTPNDINRFFADSSKVSPYSADITMDLFDDNGNPITIKDAKVPIEIFINRASIPHPAAEPCTPPQCHRSELYDDILQDQRHSELLLHSRRLPSRRQDRSLPRPRQIQRLSRSQLYHHGVGLQSNSANHKVSSQ